MKQPHSTRTPVPGREADEGNPKPATPPTEPVEVRTPKQIIIIGTNGTGKTTFAKNLVLAELKKKDSHILLVVPDDMEWNTIPFVHPDYPHRIEKYVGARKICYFPGLLEIIRDRFREGLLIFDDCRAYFTAALDSELHSILIRRRQQMIDIVAVGHGFTEIPPKFFTFGTHIALFRTIDNIDRRKNVIQNFEEMKEAQQRINSRATDTTKAWTKSGKIADNAHYYEIIKV